MLGYSPAARRWVEPLLALRAGGSVTVRFLAPATDPASDLGILPSAPDSYVDYPAPRSYVRELTAEELQTLAGQFRQGAREILLSDEFARSIAAAQALDASKQVFESAAGLLIGGQICRIRSIRPLDAGDDTYAWQLLCDAPLEAQ
ncbi:MAG: hypothetical protein HY234_03700 [Acidobacteria bacterium]|nr:hypothetical protein [Acidobacteriota bacterium]MBI3662141.1 hypothetical protein [Acidobacteriota bacterium]